MQLFNTKIDQDQNGAYGYGPIESDKEQNVDV